jgi:hypothetical protein
VELLPGRLSRNSGFAASVSILPSAFEALEIGDYEKPMHLPACFEWCIANVGIGGRRWTMSWTDGGGLLVSFAEEADARAFFAQWNDRDPGCGCPGAACAAANALEAVQH